MAFDGTIIDAAGVHIATTDTGGDRPVVLLMHGVPDCRRSWDGIIEALGDDVRCIAPDFPGFGDSPEPAPDFDFLPDGTSAMWRAFVDALALDQPFVVVVHDFGVPWMLPFVAANPDRVAGLVIADGPFHSDFQWHFWAKVWQMPGIGELATWLSGRFLFRREMMRGDPALPRTYADQAYAHTHAAAKRTILRTYRAWGSMKGALGPWEQRVLDATARVPTRVVWGALDPYVSPDFAHRFGGEAVVIPGVGHWTYLSAPERVVEEIRGSLGDVR